MLRGVGPCALVWLAYACGSSGDPDSPNVADPTASASSTSGVATSTGADANATSGASTASSDGMAVTTSGSTSGAGAGGSSSTSSTTTASATSSGGATSTTTSTTSTDAAAGTGGGTPELGGTPTEEERAPLPMSRQEHAVAALGGEIYVLGGFTDGPTVLTSVQAYNPQSDEWRDAADFPAEFHHPNVAVVGDLLYVVGFHEGSSLTNADGRSFAFDPVADEWTPRASLPQGTERGTSCVGTLANRIYVFAGASAQTTADAHVYDVELDSWEALPPMPELREHCQAAGIDGKIYIVSGRANGIEGVETESWVYDPETQVYEERAAIPTPRGGAAGALLGGRIFVLGGEGNGDDPQGIFHEVEAYDPGTDSWESYPDLLIPRHGYGAAVVGDRIYLAGGATSQGFGATANHTVFYFAPD